VRITYYTSFIFLVNSFACFITEYYLYSFLFFSLFCTSILCRTIICDETLIIDKIVAYAVILFGAYMFYLKFYIIEQLIIFLILLSFITTCVIYKYGSLHKDEEIAAKYHSLLHIISSIAHHLIIMA